MQNSKGFGPIGVVAAVMVVVVLVGAGYLFVQEMQEDSSENNQNNATEHTDQQNHEHNEHQVVEEWEEYHFEQYGLTFEHPADWQVEVTTVEEYEQRPNILVRDENGQLVTGVYGWQGGDDDCDAIAHDVSPQPGLTVGGHRATVMKTCEDKGTWIFAIPEHNDEFGVTITTDFLSQSYEEDARKLLDSMSGLTLPILN